MPDTIFLPGGGWLLCLPCPDYSYNPTIGRIIADNLMLMGIDCVPNSSDAISLIMIVSHVYAHDVLLASSLHRS